MSRLLEKQELMCVLSDPKLKDITTVTVRVTLKALTDLHSPYLTYIFIDYLLIIAEVRWHNYILFSL